MGSHSRACVTKDEAFSHPTAYSKGDSADLRKFLLDSGSSSHFTPYLEDLEDIEDYKVG